MEQIKYRQSTVDIIFVGLILFFTARSSTLARALTELSPPAILALPLMFMCYYILVRKISFSRDVIIFLIGFLLLNIALTLKYMEVHPRFYAYHMLGFLMAYFAVKAMGRDFFIHYETLVFYLCLIAISFYLMINLLGFPLINLLRSITFLQPGAGNVDTALGFFTVPVMHGSILLYRNAGFAWEPGAFSCLTALGIYVNLVLKRFDLGGNRRLWIMAVALLTSQSTTGFILLLVLAFFLVANKKISFKHKMPAYIVVIAIVGFVSTLPFMYEKIERALEFDLDRLVRNSILYGSNYVPQRFASLRVDLIDFFENPLIGYGGHNKAQWTNQIGAEIASISGIGKILARFGIVGALFFIYSLIKSSLKFAYDFNYKAWWFMPIIILIILGSYTITEQPLIICFWMYFMLSPQKATLTNPLAQKKPLVHSY